MAGGPHIAGALSVHHEQLGTVEKGGGLVTALDAAEVFFIGAVYVRC